MNRCQTFGCSNPRGCKCRKKITFPIICVIGVTASGKTSLCNKIIENYDYDYVNIGKLLEKEISSGSRRGKAIATFLNDGEFAPDEDVLHLVEIAVNKHINKDCKGLILDGFPRTKNQGILFETYITSIKHIIYLECSNEIMTQRILHRTSAFIKPEEENKISTKLNEFRKFVDELLSEFNDKTIIIDCDKPTDEILKEVSHTLNENAAQET